MENKEGKMDDLVPKQSIQMVDLKTERENTKDEFEGGDNDYGDNNQDAKLLGKTNSSVPGTIDYEGDSHGAVSARAK